MVTKNTSHRTSPPGGLVGVISRSTLRISQILVSLVIAGLYGRDISAGNTTAAWVFAEVVAGLSIVVAIIYLLPFIRSFKFFFVDVVLFLFWTGLFGAFGNRYIKTDCKKDGDCGRMKTAVWFDLIGMLLWFVSGVVGVFAFLREKHNRSMYTGRAGVV
ncbi:hypothetical protein BDD12DRAFT_915968 [Trichophaea hybrida]|nr:hypothetical protein BDD12DRAFT_915968 [Trichophaea hybrida]